MIGKFDSLLVSRSKQQYPVEMKPKHQIIGAELENFLWEKFRESR